MKKKKRDNGKAALKQRLTDLLHGAMGYAHPTDLLHGAMGYAHPTVFDGEDFGGIAAVCGLEVVGRWLGAIEKVLLREDQAGLTANYQLEHFEFMQTATDYLWQHGVRASGPKLSPTE